MKEGVRWVLGTLRVRDSPLLRIQSLQYRLQGLLGKGLLSNDSTFSRQLCNLVCRNLIGWWAIISRRECIHRTTLNCNITRNISSILQWRFTERERKLHGSMGCLGRRESVGCLGAAHCFCRLSHFSCYQTAISWWKESPSCTIWATTGV